MSENLDGVNIDEGVMNALMEEFPSMGVDETSGDMCFQETLKGNNNDFDSMGLGSEFRPSTAAADAAIAATTPPELLPSSESSPPEASPVPEEALEAARAAAAATFAAKDAVAASSSVSGSSDIFDMPVEGDIPTNKRKSTPMSSPRSKSIKSRIKIPSPSDFTGKLEMMDASTMFDIDTPVRRQAWYNIAFGIVSCLVCDNGPLKKINSDLFTDDFITNMKAHMCYDYVTSNTDGGMDIVIRRQGFNSLFANVSDEKTDNLEFRSTQLSEFTFGKPSSEVSKSNVRNFCSKIVPLEEEKGFLYENFDGYYYFCFRVKFAF